MYATVSAILQLKILYFSKFRSNAIIHSLPIFMKNNEQIPSITKNYKIIEYSLVNSESREL